MNHPLLFPFLTSKAELGWYYRKWAVWESATRHSDAKEEWVNSTIRPIYCHLNVKLQDIWGSQSHLFGKHCVRTNSSRLTVTALCVEEGYGLMLSKAQLSEEETQEGPRYMFDPSTAWLLQCLSSRTDRLWTFPLQKSFLSEQVDLLSHTWSFIYWVAWRSPMTASK